MVAKGKSDRVKLTKRQQEILVQYEQGKNVYEIASELKITRQAVEKHLKACQKKGWLPMVAKNMVSYAPATNLWRVHGLHFVIRPYYFTDKYKKNLKKLGGYNIRFSHWRVILHKDIIELRQIAGHEYHAKTQDMVLDKMQNSFDRDLARMESTYGFRVRKDRRQGVRICRIHLVRGDSVISKNTDEHVSFYNKLGERFLIVDKSKGGFDHEGVHPLTHKLDMENIEKMLQDYSDESSPRPMEVWKAVAALVELQHQSDVINRDTAANINSIVKLMLPPKPTTEPKRERIDYVI